MNEMIKYFHPGKYIKEAIEELEMSQHEFAARVGVTDKYLSTLINGDAKINFDIASKLSKMFGTSLIVWTNLQTNYDVYQAELLRNDELKQEIEIFKLIDSKFLFMKEIFEKNDNLEERIQKLRQALPVANLSNLQKTDLFSFYRISGCKNESEYSAWIVNSNVWLSLALVEAKKVDTPKFDEKKLRQSMTFIRNMTINISDDYDVLLKKTLLTCGVNLVIMPYLKKSRINGLVRWMPELDNVVVALNGKGQYFDTFWFTLFHELGHVFQKVKRRMIVDGIDEELEDDANQFARNELIPNDKYSAFISNFKHSTEEVIEFSQEIGVHPGIVVGRLHNDKISGFDKMNNLRQKVVM